MTDLGAEYAVVAGRKRVQRPLTEGEVLPVERAVIGCVLLEGSARLPSLLPHEFFLGAHRTIWMAILELDAAQSGVNILTVNAQLARIDEHHASLLGQCLEDAAIGPYLTDYAGLVRQAARERMLKALGIELQAQGLSEDEIRRRLDDLPGPLTASLVDPAEDWAAIVKTWGGARILTGLRALDTLSGGLVPGVFVVVAGRTSHGKTAAMTHFAHAFAVAGHTVEYLPLEESRVAIRRRLIANRTGISVMRLTDGMIFGDEFPQAEAAVRWMQDAPLTITGVEDLRSIDEDTVVGMVAASTARIVIVDHLQQITTKDQSRVYGLERVVKRLHAAALRDGKVLLAGAQLGRDMDDPPRPPRLSDIRDSAAIEHSARQVWLLYWPCKHKRERAATEYELYVAKHSDGPTGVASLHFEAAAGRFSDADRRG